jgi:hypothetical protein
MNDETTVIGVMIFGLLIFLYGWILTIIITTVFFIVVKLGDK